jgi:hypothetical protein
VKKNRAEEREGKKGKKKKKKTTRGGKKESKAENHDDCFTGIIFNHQLRKPSGFVKRADTIQGTSCSERTRSISTERE